MSCALVPLQIAQNNSEEEEEEEEKEGEGGEGGEGERDSYKLQISHFTLSVSCFSSITTL